MSTPYFLKTLVALSAAEGAPDPQQGIEGLVNWGVFQKLNTLSQNLGRVGSVSKKDASGDTTHVSSVVHTILLRIIKITKVPTATSFSCAKKGKHTNIYIFAHPSLFYNDRALLEDAGAVLAPL